MEGFYINYYVVRRGGELVFDLFLELNYMMIVCVSVMIVIFIDLMIYIMYKIEVVLIIFKGMGKLSEFLYVGICKNIFFIC